MSSTDGGRLAAPSAPRPSSLKELAKREAALDVVERELARARDGREHRFAYDEIIGQSEAIRSMLRVVDRVTTSEVPVLVIGESGSGKELVARAIHQNGPRGKNAFVSENCRRHPREPAREHALRARARRVHRRVATEGGALRRGAPRHAVPSTRSRR